MTETVAVEHVTFVSDRSYEDVIAAFEENVGTLEKAGWSSIVAGSPNRADFEQRITKTLGPSGFTRFLTIDHGEWVTMSGRPAQFMMYLIGNPLIAITMIEHDIEAGLDVPVRLAIYVHPDGRTRLVYNKPSTLMGSLKSQQLRDAAAKLDAKLQALAESVTGTTSQEDIHEP